MWRCRCTHTVAASALSEDERSLLEIRSSKVPTRVRCPSPLSTCRSRHIYSPKRLGFLASDDGRCPNYYPSLLHSRQNPVNFNDGLGSRPRQLYFWGNNEQYRLARTLGGPERVWTYGERENIREWKFRNPCHSHHYTDRGILCRWYHRIACEAANSGFYSIEFVISEVIRKYNWKNRECVLFAFSFMFIRCGRTGLLMSCIPLCGYIF
jgi:hypothetical protein